MPEITRALLLYRYRRLGEARVAARAAGYRGAMFPWQSGSNGREETDVEFFNPRSGRWIADRSRLQRHVGAAVAYDVWQYYEVTGDLEFLVDYGAEMLLDMARFWASEGYEALKEFDWEAYRRRYGNLTIRRFRGTSTIITRGAPMTRRSAGWPIRGSWPGRIAPARGTSSRKPS